MAQGMQQLSAELPGGGLGLCLGGGGLDLLGGGEAAHRWSSLLAFDAWHVMASSGSRDQHVQLKIAD